ncbi:PD-(D/E)XK nuclease domain-containing protein [Stratiformator vulcanicus]|uniref:Uncharacterized protein n=1 Tax=Stratiformator vulcanicus TaxID=2527980 RepID=A0A517R008_9PLAN|nr:hypothetical protein [Stratiformator vulcanicus]QDT37232.1 hypothetical protein Pan189_16050 [Stratiformator vulcanicus]
MQNIKIPRSVCAVVASVLHGSHPVLDAKFASAGVPGPPPDLPHATKWKEWLYRAGKDPSVDSLCVLGSLIEEFMDVPPLPNSGATFKLLGQQFGDESNPLKAYQEERQRLETTLEAAGLRYFNGGRVLPISSSPSETVADTNGEQTRRPQQVEELIEVIVRGANRAMYPLTHRRKGLTSLTFTSEYDIQDLLHSHLRSWIADIRPEEYTPSYAGVSTRMDFLLPRYKMVIEVKRVRDKSHASRIGQELIIDMEHYRAHPSCDSLWCVVYDPGHFIENPNGITKDLEGKRTSPGGSVSVRIFVL